MQIDKISSYNSSINFRSNLKKFNAKKLLNLSIRKEKELPMIFMPPIVMYNLKGRRDANNTINCNNAIAEQKKLLKNGKISESDYNERVKEIKNYYGNADNLPADVSSSSIKRKEPQFKGSPDDMSTSSVEMDSGFKIDSSGDIDIKSIDTKMCPELETIYNAPPINTPEGLVKTIFGELPEGVDLDWDLWSALKNLASDIFNPGEWFT